MANIKFNPTRDWIVLPAQRRDKTDSGIELVGGAENSLRTNVLEVVAKDLNSSSLDVDNVAKFILSRAHLV